MSLKHEGNFDINTQGKESHVKTHTHTLRRQLCEDRGRNWSDVVASQVLLASTKNWKRAKKDSSLETSETA